MQTRHLEIVTAIAAPAEVVFDTSLAVDVHTASMAASGECAVGGVTTGRLRLGDEVTWQARHLGRSWRMTSRITTYSRPTCFVDEQTSGPFAVWRHAHHFEPQGAATLMRDVIDFAAPFGPLGRLTAIVLLDRYMTKLIATRNQYLAAICQAGRSA
jgi:ligand-binding SRPBCC domain-containing protein